MAGGKDGMGIDGIALGQQALLSSQLQRLQNSQATRKGGGAAPSMDAAHDKEVTKAATQFESMLVNEMLKSMWASVPKDGMLSGSREEELFQGLLQESIADTIATNQSIGVKDVIIRDIKATERRAGKGAPVADEESSNTVESKS